MHIYLTIVEGRRLVNDRKYENVSKMRVGFQIRFCYNESSV